MDRKSGETRSERPRGGWLLHNPRVVLAIGASCLAVAILGASELVVRQERAAATEAAERQTEMLARSLRDRTDARLGMIESLIRFIGFEARQDGLESAAKYMARLAGLRSGQFTGFFLLDAKGRTLWKNGPSDVSPEIAAEHLAAHRQGGQLHISPAVRQPQSGTWHMHLSYPVSGRDGGLQGMVLAESDLSRLQRDYVDMNLGTAGMLELLRKDGVLIARVTGTGIVAGDDRSAAERVGQASLGGEGCSTGILAGFPDGVERISSLCAIGGALLVGAGISVADAIDGHYLTATRYRFIALLLVGLLAGGTLLLLYALLTRQQATQRALSSSESRFRALSALGSDWYWETDAEYQLTHVSEGFFRMCGRSVQEVLGRPRWDIAFITPVGSDWTEHKAAIARRVSFHDLAVRHIGPQGVVAYGSISGEPVFRDDGSLAGYRGVGNDITAEIVLRQRMRMQHEVTRSLSHAKSETQAIQAVIETICRTMEWTWGAHRHLDPETLLLTCHEHWLAPGSGADAFVSFALQPKTGDPEHGTVSRAIRRGEIIWFTDHTPVSLRRSNLAREAGLRGVVAVPIRRSRSIEDALEFFSERVEAPDQVMIDTLEAIGYEIGQFMDHAEAQQTSTHLERERRHLLDMLELQLEHMPVACLLQDRDFMTVYCNPAAERIFGYSSDELRGADLDPLIVAEKDREKVLERQRRLKNGGAVSLVARENIRKDGTRIICEWSHTPLTDESGKFAGVLATAQDVTERMKMLAALEDSEERYRQIFAATPLPMWVTETQMPRFIAVNDATVEKYGYTREEFLNMTALDLQPEEDRELVLRQLLERDPSLPAQFERRHVTKDGRMITVEVTAHSFQFGSQQARLVTAIDITDRKRGQLALEESEARFRAVFEQASVGIAIRELSAEPRFLRVNRRLCEILGYSESELLKMTTTVLTVDEDLDSTREMNRQLVSGSLRSYSRKKRYRRKDGRDIWVNLSVSQIDEGQGGAKVSHLISVIEDISEQVENEERVLESEARYRQIFALTPLPMFLRDEETLAFLEVNDACLAMYGYTREEMLTLTVADLQAPENRQRYLDEMSRGADIVRLQKQHAGKGGRLFDVEIYSCPTTLAGRRVRLALIRDMSDQLRMERLLRDNESRLRAIADNVPAVVAFFDAGLQLQYSNLAYDRWFGSARLNVRDGVMRVEQDVSRYHETLTPLLEQAMGGDEVTTERTLDTDAGPRIARLTLIPHVADNGTVTGVHLMGYDLTDFRHAEAEVHQLNAELEQRVERRTRALAAANRELESFSYSVSHDLRAPLRTIDGFSQILLDEYAAKLDDTGRGYLERVRAGSQRMAKLIDDLLELARVTRRDLQIRDCDLTALVREILRELSIADPGRKVAVSVAEGMTVAADAGLLRIALDNLLRNAWKFTSLTSNAAIEIGFTGVADGRTYFVRDNGVGFDMAYVGKLFGAFQRLHSESEFQGTGIGLALVQRVIRRHGGQVWADAEHGQGASFFFTLPAQLADAEDAIVGTRAETTPR